ncbi:MAG TPA: hypothetical protein VKB32_09275 [Actinomycetota bacterium]|nr:hypothetical protein [Actinomycetota bacterium]
MSDPGLVHRGDRTPQVGEQRVGHLGGGELPDGTTLGPQDQHAVASSRDTGRDHRQHGDPGALGEQRDEGLVLDLLPAADREGAGLVSIPEVGPRRGEELAVPGVAPKDLDEQRQPPRRLGPQEDDALGLEFGRPQIDRLHPELRERGPELFQRWEPAW